MSQQTFLDKILRQLGINPVQLRWRLRRMAERARQRKNAFENQQRALAYRHKVCSQCGLTVDRKERRCPRCSTPLLPLVLSRLQRLFRLVFPAGAYTVTSIFVTLNVAFYLVMWLQSGGGPSALGQGIEPLVIYRFGAATVYDVFNGDLWRLVTPIFLHFDLMHIIFNSLWLINLGPMVESFYGAKRYLALYVLSGVGGNLISMIVNGFFRGHLSGIHAGASSVVFGLMGAALILAYVRRTSGSDLFRAGLVKWIILGVILSFLPGIDLWAHFGGGASGAACAMLFATTSDRRSPRSERAWTTVAWLAVAIVVTSILFAWANPPVIGA